MSTGQRQGVWYNSKPGICYSSSCAPESGLQQGVQAQGRELSHNILYPADTPTAARPHMGQSAHGAHGALPRHSPHAVCGHLHQKLAALAARHRHNLVGGALLAAVAHGRARGPGAALAAHLALAEVKHLLKWRGRRQGEQVLRWGDQGAKGATRTQGLGAAVRHVHARHREQPQRRRRRRLRTWHAAADSSGTNWPSTNVS